MGGPHYRRAVVTGGSSGIGLAAARLLVLRGTDVLIVARNSEKLAAAAELLTGLAAGKAQVETAALDISDRAAVEAFGGRIAKTAPPDLLINCAGTAHPDYFDKLDSALFDTAVRTNLAGTWNMLKAVVPLMAPGSCIVNVSSMAGLLGTFGYTAYAATKFGIIGMSEALRNELSLRKIRVAVLCPPDTDTPQLEQENRTKPPETRAISGNAGILSPEKVARDLFSGLAAHRFIIIPGMQSRLIYLLKRLFPGLVFRMIDKYAKKPIGNTHE